MTAVLASVAHAVSVVLDATKTQHCVIGGLAIQRWGKPRVTADVDFVAFTGIADREEVVVDALLARFVPRRPDARGFALVNRVVLLSAPNGVGIDVSLGGLDFERGVVERATTFAFEDGTVVRTCSAEDLVVLKAFADRPRDWSDIEGIAIRQGERLDWGAIDERLQPLAELKDEPQIVTRLRALRDAHQPRNR